MRCGKQIAKSFSRRVCVPEPCQPRRQEKIRPRHKRREAKRRQAHCPTNRRLRGGASIAGRARLSALHRGTRHWLLPRWLSPRTGFPEVSSSQVFCPPASSPRLSTLRADRSFCRPTGAPEPPGSGSHPSARGDRTRSRLPKVPSRKAPLDERDSLLPCNAIGDDCQWTSDGYFGRHCRTWSGNPWCCAASLRRN